MSDERPIRVLIVDDHPVVREGLHAMIDRQADMTVVAEAGSAEEALEHVRRLGPDVVLMDLRLPGMGGADATAVIARDCPHCRVIVLTLYDGDEDIARALRAGACAYLLKDTFREQMLGAIRTAHGGGHYLPAEVKAKLAQRVPASALSRREMEVLRLLAKGRNNKQIATELATTEGTIKGYVHTLLSKLGAADRVEAVTMALQRGIVHLDW